MKKIINLIKVVLLFAVIFIFAACSGNNLEKPVDPNSQLRIDAMKEIHKKEQEMLNTYGVIDKKAGIYRIPVERAMEVIAAESN